jgi:streptogramin lyase
MIKKATGALIGILLLSVSVVFGQTEHYRFRHFGVEDGLISLANYSITQDQKGYLWLASEAGIIKFNGRDFKTFNFGKELPFTTTFDLNIDKQGTVWCSTGDGRIYYVRNDSLFVPACSDSLHNFLSKGKRVINEIGVSADNRLWIGNTLSMAVAEPGEGYSKLHLYRNYVDTVNTVIQVIGKGKTIMSKNKLDLPVPAYPKGNGVVAYPDGYSVNYQVVFGDGSSSVFTVKYPASQRYIPTGESIELQDGSVLFSMSNSFCQAFKNGTHKIYNQAEFVQCLSQDHFGNIWVGTTFGLLLYRDADLQSVPDTLLADKSINGVLVDKDNGLWVATSISGLYYAPNLFHTYLQMPGTEDESACLAVFQQGKYIYAFTNAAGEFRIDSGNNLMSIPSENDRLLLETISDGTYFYSYRLGVNRLDSSMHFVKEISKISFYSATRDKEGNVLFIGGEGVYSLSQDSLRQICRIREGKPTSIAVTIDGRIWIGTSADFYQLKNDQLEKVNAVDTKKDTIRRVRHLFADKKGDLYVINIGVGIYILHDNSWHRIDSSSIPMFNGGHRVFTDTDGRIWACTGLGLLSFRYDFNARKCYEVTLFEWRDGLLPGVVLAALKYNGNVYAATATGLSVFKDSPLSFNRNAPSTFISRVEINDSLLKQTLAVPVFSYDQNSFRFFIDVLDYQARGKAIFKYKLSGFDKSFLTSNEASISYTNLPSGEYELIVTGISSNGFESGPVTFKFRIRPPFWMTWWFIAMEIIIGASLIALYLRFRIRKVKRQEEEKSAINIRMASYQMAALRAQMNPHFIFNAINSIQRFVLGNDQQTAYGYLAKFSRLIRQVLNNSKEELISLKDELDTLNLYLEMENLRFAKQFDFEVKIDQSIPTADTYIPCMLIQPFIENAIWHGIMPLDNSRKGKIKLQFLRKELSLLVVIEDNGAGRKTSDTGSKSHKSMGISIAKNRLHLYDMQAKEGHSTIEYTDLKTETGESCGTIVRIELDGFFNEKRNESNHS